MCSCRCAAAALWRDGAYDCHGVGFSYPSAWSAVDDVRIVPPGNPEFVDIVGLDQLNNVQPHGFQMSRPVHDSNVKQFKRPTRVEVGGVQGFRLQVEGAIGDQALTFTGFALVQGNERVLPGLRVHAGPRSRHPSGMPAGDEDLPREPTAQAQVTEPRTINVARRFAVSW
jgi:hypothetical protein